MPAIIALLSKAAAELADHAQPDRREAARLLRALIDALRLQKPAPKALGDAARRLEKLLGRPRSRGQMGLTRGVTRLTQVIESELREPGFTTTGLAALVCEVALVDASVGDILPFDGSLVERRRAAKRAIDEALGSRRAPDVELIVTSLARAAGFSRPSRLFDAAAKRAKRQRGP